MNEVERQGLIDQLNDLDVEGEKILEEIEKCRLRVKTTKDYNVLKHIDERLEDLSKLLEDNNKKMSEIVKKLKSKK